METYTITGMGHGTPVDPGTGESQCGTAGAYILDANICSSYHIGHFWGLDNLDGVAPTVSLTSPADGSTVNGNVALAAVASDDVGVERVEFLVDGVLVGSDTSAPYTATWDASAASNGPHAVQARARDLVDNVGTSAVAHVTVTGGDDGGEPLTLDFANEAALDGYVKAAGDGGGAAVGTLEAYLGLAVGRGTDGKFNRSLLSFDTSALPDGATITSATLTVAYRSAYGDPWSSPAGNALVVDVHTGCLGACTVEASDWANTPTASAVAQVPAFSGGSQASTAFSAAGRAAINKGGRTQVKLRFAQDPLATHYLWLDNGASAILSVTYTP